MTALAPRPATVDAFSFTVTCPQCSGSLRQIQNVRQSPVSNIAVVECANPRCGRQHDLTVRLTPDQEERMTDHDQTLDGETATGCQSELGTHYAVISPVRWLSQPVYAGDQPDPGEQGSYYVEVVAENRRHARVLACRTVEFQDWVTEARGDNKPPMAGLVVEPMLCEHDKCWGCEVACSECEAEAEQAYQDEMESERVRRSIDLCRRCDALGLVYDPRAEGCVVSCDHMSPYRRSASDD